MSRSDAKKSSTPNYITPDGLEALRGEYQELFRDERPKLVETVAWAASNGDRSENGDYIYGKRRLREIDRRLRYLRKKIESAEVVDPKKMSSEKIVFGATVEFTDEDGASYKWQIVGEDESHPEVGKVSWKSPLAKSLLGKAVGDEILLKRPKGDIFVEVTKIEFK